MKLPRDSVRISAPSPPHICSCLEDPDRRRHPSGAKLLNSKHTHHHDTHRKSSRRTSDLAFYVRENEASESASRRRMLHRLTTVHASALTEVLPLELFHPHLDSAEAEAESRCLLIWCNGPNTHVKHLYALCDPHLNNTGARARRRPNPSARWTSYTRLIFHLCNCRSVTASVTAYKKGRKVALAFDHQRRILALLRPWA